MIKRIIYKGKIYNVTDPGQLIYNKDLVLGDRYGKIVYQILDQLDNNKPISRWSRKIYLKRKYGISELDYYIIVVLEGDESKLPICKYKNPYTGEVCTNPRKFRSLCPKEGRSMFYDGCKDHVSNVAAQIKQRECYKKGITGLQKADRRSPIWRDRLRKHALSQMSEGKSIFSPDDIRDPNIVSRSDCQYSIKELKNFYQEVLNNHQENLSDLEIKITATHLMYLDSGNPEDECSYYIAELEGLPEVIKFGVLKGKNPSSRNEYRGYRYKDAKIIYTSTRKIIADLEFKVKIKYQEYLKLGTEGFDINFKEEILEYIKELISSTTI